MQNLFAVIMGFNIFADKDRLPDLKFAEKDATDFYTTLIDPEIGDCKSENIVLLTGDISQDLIETKLFTQIVKNRKPDDIVLVYYSGHGFIAGDNQQAYLATPKVSVLEILDNPKAGLQMDYLHNEIFKQTKAGFTIFILDCCNSGAFCIDYGKGVNQKALVDEKDYSTEGRVAFVSCPKGVLSRESNEVRNGVFTHYLLKGLHGEAIEPFSGEITLNSLITYVQAMSPSSQKPINYGSGTRIVLAHPVQKRLGNSIDQTFKTYNASLIKVRKFKKPQFLENPIEFHINYLKILIDKCEGMQEKIKNQLHSDFPIGNSILTAINESLGTEFVFFLQIREEKTLFIKYQSDFLLNMDREDYRDSVIEDLYPSLICEKKDIQPYRYGFHRPFESIKDSSKFLVAIPIRFEYPREFLVICGISAESLKYGEIIGHAMITLYKSTRELNYFRVEDLETDLMDNIKRCCSNVPYSLYIDRYNKFKDKLKTIIFYFEPIIALGTRSPEIDSWEALARDPYIRKAPYGLFNAAELWGPEFITELDLYCLENAVRSYDEYWSNERGTQKKDILSVNVYPETLSRKSYKELLKSLIKKDIIKAQGLVVELSEKRSFPDTDQLSDDFSDDDPVLQFRKKINEYTNEFGVSFAIDDFGVQNSSIKRLARLELDHVKIDRFILQHSFPACTIQYVNELVALNHLHARNIVVEGFDEFSNLSLKELFDLQIKYVQGHKLRRASPTVKDLTQDEREFIKKELAV